MTDRANPSSGGPGELYIQDGGRRTLTLAFTTNTVTLRLVARNFYSATGQLYAVDAEAQVNNVDAWVTHWLTTDRQGNVRDSYRFGFNADGSVGGWVFARFDYQDWGKPNDVKPDNGHEGLYGADPHLLQQFQGAFHDGDLDAYKFGDRWMSTGIKRWLSEDPSGLRFGGNPNMALNNSPHNFRDPTGHWIEDLVIGLPSLGLGAWSLDHNIQEGNFGGAMVDAVGIVADAAALALPFIPGGAGAAIKAARTANTFADANRALQGTSWLTRGIYRTSQGVQTADFFANGYQFYDASRRDDFAGMFFSSLHLSLRGLQGLDRMGYEVQSLGLLTGPGFRIRRKAVGPTKVFDFGKHLRGLIGDAPPGMIDPHAHHILFKKGLGPAQQTLVDEGQAILRKVGIDPIFGKENLVWAPWRVVKQHGIDSLTTVVQKLRELAGIGADYDDFAKALKKLGEEAARRGT